MVRKRTSATRATVKQRPCKTAVDGRRRDLSRPTTTEAWTIENAATTFGDYAPEVNDDGSRSTLPTRCVGASHRFIITNRQHLLRVRKKRIRPKIPPEYLVEALHLRGTLK